MSLKHIRKEVNSIKKQLNMVQPLNWHRLNNLTQEEHEIMIKASRILNDLHERGLVIPNKTNPDMVDVVGASDEDYEALDKAVEILRG